MKLNILALLLSLFGFALAMLNQLSGSPRTWLLFFSLGLVAASLVLGSIAYEFVQLRKQLEELERALHRAGSTERS